MAFSIADTRMIICPGDTLIADETVKIGNNGLFNGRLVQRSQGRFDLEVFMKVQFFFMDGKETDFASPQEARWTSAERESYIRRWHQIIKSKWDRQNVGRISKNFVIGMPGHNTDTDPACTVDVEFNFVLQDGGWLMDHFEVEVFKIPSSERFGGKGSVQARRRLSHYLILDHDVELDSNSLNPRSEADAKTVRYYGTPAEAGFITAVHEFGHMIGLGEEYQDSLFTKDIKSVMNHGPVVRPRHYSGLLSWAVQKLREHAD